MCNIEHLTIAELKESYKNLWDANSELNAKNIQQQKDLESINAKSKETMAKFQEYEKQLKTSVMVPAAYLKQAELECNDKLACAKAEIDHYIKFAQKAKEEVATLTNVIILKDKEYNNMEALYKHTKKLKDEQEDRNENQNAQINRYKKDMEILKEKCKALERQAGIAPQQTSIGQWHQLQETIATLKRQNDTQAQTIAAYQKEFSQKSDKEYVLSKNVDHFRAEADKWKRNFEASTEICEKQSLQIADMKQDIERYNSRLAQIKYKINEISNI